MAQDSKDNAAEAPQEAPQSPKGSVTPEGKGIAIPIRMSLTDPEGKSVELVLEGADILQISRIDLAQAANNLEHAIRSGCFASQPLEKQHAVMGLAIRLKEISSTPPVS